MAANPTNYSFPQPLGDIPPQSPLPFGHAALPPVPKPPSLDDKNKGARCLEPPSEWQLALAEKRRRRFYQRAMTGMKLGGNLRLLTLTTSEESWVAGKDIQRSFRAFILRLRRRKWCLGYVKVVEFTKRGRPHLHVILRGPYVSFWWLSQVWQEIHMSEVVDVRRVYKPGRLGNYLAKYLGKDMRARYSWSHDWVWRGFVADWKALCREGFENGASMLDIIDVWGVILDRYRLDRVLEGG